MIDDAVTDEALLLAARTDAEAFTRFYRRHATPVLGYLVRRTRDPELGADLTAETFACALEGLTRFVCPTYHEGSDTTGFLVDGRPLPVDLVPGVGHWRWAAASPDGKTILAQWSAECEVPQAYLLDAEGGKPRPLAPDYAFSEAYGWTTDGRAIVFLPKLPACGTEFKPGLYLISPDGRQRTRIVPARRGVEPLLKPSLRPRTVDDVIREATQ
jgi:hypothetical protein